MVLFAGLFIHLIGLELSAAVKTPRFLFILAPPYSGSTALAAVLNSSPASMQLNQRAEGQWMVPALSGEDRWDPRKLIDWDEVRKIWLNRYRVMDEHEGPFDVVIEKSPPHMVRATQLLAAFPGAACIAFNRDPYANCASILHRLHTSVIPDPEKRSRKLAGIAEDWITRSDYLRKSIDEISLLYFSYETFCAQPEWCITRVLEICPELVSVDCSRQIRVKDYPPQGISNQNDRQIGLLDERDIEAVSDVLIRRVDLLDYFGYTVR